jgi:energy-converting hydrogenase Eha subunit H
MIGHPAAGTTAEDARVLAAQQALLSHDLGSMQEDALTAVVEASIADAEASGDDAVAPTYAQRLAQFRAVELSLGQSLGADQQVSSCALES